MTLLEIDKLYKDALPYGASFGGHPTQQAAAAAMFNCWILLLGTILALEDALLQHGIKEVK